MRSLLACLFAAAVAGAAPAERLPNVLVVLVDDLGYSDLGCYGGEIPTPNIDRLAAGGVRFEKCYNSARCCPTRASLLTGLHPHEAGIGDFVRSKPTPNAGEAYTGHLLASNQTLPELLATCGYSTWMVGKWHMGSPGPLERGFQHYFGFKDFGAHSEGQWNPAKYVRLPATEKPEFSHENGRFYATDVFTDYACEFLARPGPIRPSLGSSTLRTRRRTSRSKPRRPPSTGTWRLIGAVGTSCGRNGSSA